MKTIKGRIANINNMLREIIAGNDGNGNKLAVLLLSAFAKYTRADSISVNLNTLSSLTEIAFQEKCRPFGVRDAISAEGEQ